MSGAIEDLSERPPPAEITVEVCIVGSGCGGATAAWELAQAGREVLVLEEGGDFTGLELTQRDGAMYDQLYMGRGGRTTDDLSVSILQGRVLGGGGVVNVCDVVPIGDDVLRHWQRKYGLTDFGPEQLAPLRQLALDNLSANHPQEGQFNANNRLLRKGAQALGWKGEVMLHNRVGCAGVGACLLGCPLDRKKNPRFVAIPAALAAGARFFTRARALRIEQAGAELKTLRACRLDAKGYREGEPFVVRAKTVILAANAIGSAELLLRSGLGNEHVGRHLSLQPQLPITAMFAEEVRFFRGIPQAYAVTEFEERDHPEHGWWGFRIEAIGATPGIVASLLPELGAVGRERMARYPHQAASLMLLPDEPQGSLSVEGGRLRVRYALTDEQRQRYRKAIKESARAYFAAGAQQVFVPLTPPLVLQSEADLAKVDQLAFPPATVPLMSAHQQGTVRMAPSPSQGGADPDGQVFGTKGVYVFDSSGFPTTASSHTMAPILTVSRYLSRKLLARAG